MPLCLVFDRTLRLVTFLIRDSQSVFPAPYISPSLPYKSKDQRGEMAPVVSVYDGTIAMQMFMVESGYTFTSQNALIESLLWPLSELREQVMSGQVNKFVGRERLRRFLVNLEAACFYADARSLSWEDFMAGGSPEFAVDSPDVWEIYADNFGGLTDGNIDPDDPLSIVDRLLPAAEFVALFFPDLGGYIFVFKSPETTGGTIIGERGIWPLRECPFTLVDPGIPGDVQCFILPSDVRVGAEELERQENIGEDRMERLYPW